MGRTGLTTRIVLTMLVVALVAFLAAAVLTAPLVRSSAQRSARETLSHQVDLLAQLPNARNLTACYGQFATTPRAPS